MATQQGSKIAKPNIVLQEPQYNGRVPGITSVAMDPYPRTYQNNDHAFRKTAIKGILNNTELSDLFFSDKNIEALQHGIRYAVYTNTCQKHTIGNQSEDELRIVMRSIFLQHSKNQPFNILEQVRELNSLVLDYCVERIVNELNMYQRYTNDLNSYPQPMPRAVSTSSAGTRVLEVKGF